MQIALVGMLVAIALMIIVPGAVGVRHGVYRGFLTLVGTLLGAVLVDVMQPHVLAWVDRALRVERPGVVIWWVQSVAFLAVALIVGYGGNVLVRQETIPIRHDWRDMLLGFLLGALNGAVIVSYLLNYARGLPESYGIAPLVASSLVVQIVRDWVAWFIAAVVVVLSAYIAVRLMIRLVRQHFGSQHVPGPVSSTTPGEAVSSANEAVAVPGETAAATVSGGPASGEAAPTIRLTEPASAGPAAPQPPGASPEQAVVTRVLQVADLQVDATPLTSEPAVDSQQQTD